MTRSSASTPGELEFRWSGGRRCLDLVATLGRRHAVPVERLPDEDALVRWLAHAGLVPDDDAPVTASARQLADARQLREAVNRLVRATVPRTGATKRGGYPADDVALVNAVARRADLAPQLTGRGAGEARRGWVADDPVDAALSTLARDAIDLLTGAASARVKECAHPDCSLLFLDDSQAGRRRWCSMERCGNLVKVAAYRSRAAR